MDEISHIKLGKILLLLSVLLKFGLGSDADDEMRKLQEAFWESQMRTNPTLSSYLGMYGYNDLMESFAMSRFEEDKTRTTGFMEQLTAIDREKLDEGGKVNFDLLKDTLQTFLDGHKWAEYGALSPFSFLWGIQLYNVPFMAPSSTRGDFENYIVRLHAVQRQVDETIASSRRAIELKRTLHNVSVARVPQQIDRSLYDTPEESPFFHAFGKKLNESHVQNEMDREDVRRRGREAVTAYMNALRELRSFVVDEYMPNTRTEYGVYAWDPTNEFYKACLKWHLSFAMSPDDVHNVGLEEVGKISSDMQRILTKLSFEGSVREFFESLEGDERFYTNDTDKILAEFRKVVYDRIQPKLRTMFKNIPDIPLVIMPSPSDGTTGLYLQTTDNTPGRFIINLFRPMDVPSFQMMALSLHEALPGHHLQHSYSIEANLPDFRKHSMFSYYNVPYWFPGYTAYVEGWGLYSEYLGEEMGLYKDDYELMGRYSYDILRAVRLVVDTGLHYKKWSRQRAIEYLMNHTSLSVGLAENQIDRYITFPGQACAYKLGELRIRALRTKAESELGTKFDIKDFHYFILANGRMPMSLLERMTDAWIEQVKTQTSAASLQVIVTQTLVFGPIVLCWLLA